jgi:transposase
MNDRPEDRQWIGIDVSKRCLDVYIRPLGRAVQVANSKLGLIELYQHLDGLVIGLICWKPLAAIRPWRRAR